MGSPKELELSDVMAHFEPDGKWTKEKTNIKKAYGVLQALLFYGIFLASPRPPVPYRQPPSSQPAIKPESKHLFLVYF
jgi:hypothetical protein